MKSILEEIKELRKKIKYNIYIDNISKSKELEAELELLLQQYHNLNKRETSKSILVI